jgi:hypothetical protein
MRKIGTRAFLTSTAVLVAAFATISSNAQETTETAKVVNDISLTTSLSKSKPQPEATPFALEVYAEIKNTSSVDMIEAKFAMSDDSCSDCDPPIVKEINFGKIAAGKEEKKTTTFPTGIEKVIIVYTMDGDDEPYSLIGLGDNAPGVTLTITD